MSRSTKKPFYVAEAVNRKFLKVSAKKTSGEKVEPIKIYQRDSTILSDYIGYTFLVHKGNKFVPVYITSEHIGYKFGDFVLTRVTPKHPEKSTLTQQQAKPAAKPAAKSGSGGKK